VRQVHDGRLSLKHSLHSLTIMSRQATTVASSARGRIVMLVDNNVTPDSRVQKQARSAAERAGM
jgi:hypothetical protein